MARSLTPRLARRKKRVSANIIGSSDVPRIAIHRSNKFVYAQAIDDSQHRTVAAVTTLTIEKKSAIKKTDAATQAGEELGNKLKAAKVEKAVIDRGRFHYQGRVAALVEGLRKSGIQV